MYTLTINITKEVLKEAMYCGTSKSDKFTSQSCAIAVAVREIFPYAAVGIFSFLIDADKNESTMAVDLPAKARHFINEFDSLSVCPEDRLEMEEFSFDVTLPEEAFNEINIDQVKEILKTSKTLELHEC